MSDQAARVAHGGLKLLQASAADLASGMDTPLSTLARLATDSRMEIRRLVAKNPNLPEEYRQLGRVAQ
jgi:hypothetical protein